MATRSTGYTGDEHVAGSPAGTQKVLQKLQAVIKAATPGPTEAEMAEHAVIVQFQYGSTDLEPLFELENQLESAIETAKAGEYDGNEIAGDGGDARLYMYGRDADRLEEVVRPILGAASFMKGARITKRYGPPEAGVREVVVDLGS
jgi:hypothetical protein